MRLHISLSGGFLVTALTVVASLRRDPSPGCGEAQPSKLVGDIGPRDLRVAAEVALVRSESHNGPRCESAG